MRPLLTGNTFQVCDSHRTCDPPPPPAPPPPPPPPLFLMLPLLTLSTGKTLVLETDKLLPPSPLLFPRPIG